MSKFKLVACSDDDPDGFETECILTHIHLVPYRRDHVLTDFVTPGKTLVLTNVPGMAASVGKLLSRLDQDCEVRF